MGKQHLSFPEIHQKLQNIFQCFLAGRLPKDDTMVEKLDNWLKEWLQTVRVAQFLQETRICDILREVDLDKTQGGAVAFFLKILSSLQQQDVEEGSVISASRDLYGAATSSTLWGSAAVRNAWLKGLTALLTYNELTTTAWLTKDEHLSVVLRSLDDSSIFVSQASVDLLSLLVSSLIKYGDQNHQAYTQHLDSTTIQCQQRTIATIWTMWDDSIGKNEKMSTVITEMVLKIMKGGRRNCDILYDAYGLLDKIARILDSSSDIRDGLRDLCLEVLTCCKSHMSPGDVQKLEALVCKQLETGSVRTAMKLTSWLLLRQRDQLKDVKKVEAVLFLPTNYMLWKLDSENSALLLDPVGKQRLSSSHGQLAGLLLTQLELIRQIHEQGNLEKKHIETLQGILHCLTSSTPSCLMKVTGQDRVLHSVLDTLHYVFTTRPDAENIPSMRRTINNCITLLDREPCLQTSVTVQKILKCVQACVVFITLHPNATVESLKRSVDGDQVTLPVWADDDWNKLFLSLAKILSHPSWEVVDTGLEFLTCLLQDIKDPQHMKAAFSEDTFCASSQIMRSLDHSESYLRATALQCVSAMAAVQAIWEIHTSKYPQDILVDKIIHFIQANPDAFTRRAASDALRTLFDLDLLTSRSSDVTKVMCEACRDEDWEVKRSALQFWSTYIKQCQECNKTEMPEYAQGLDPSPVKDPSQHRQIFLQSLTDSGCLAVLMESASDCDKPVQELACTILVDLKVYLKDNFQMCKDTQINNGVSAPMHNGCRESTDVTVGRLLQALYELDLDSLLGLARLSTDQYDLNPVALLDDILSCARSQTGDALSDSDEDNAIDCY